MITHHTLYFSAADALSEQNDASVALVVTSPPYPMIEMWDTAFAEWDSRRGAADGAAGSAGPPDPAEPRGSAEASPRGQSPPRGSAEASPRAQSPPRGSAEASPGAQSPPRGSALRSALEDGRGWDAFEIMHSLLDPVWSECFRLLREGGFLIVNTGDATRSIGGQFAMYPNHARILTACVAAGFTPLPGVLWRKQTNAPNKFMGSGMLPAGAYVTLEHEHILVLRKGGKREFRTPADKARRRESALLWEERNSWFSDLWEFKGDRQNIGDSAARNRSAAFPFELPFRIVNMYSLIDDLVLDPFAGTGTTLAAAASCGRHSVGYEVDVSFRAPAVATCSRIPDAGRARQEQRLREHSDFVARANDRGKPRLGHHNSFHDTPVVTAQERELALMSPARVEWLEGVYPEGRRGEGDQPGDPHVGSGKSRTPTENLRGGLQAHEYNLDLFPVPDSDTPLKFNVHLEPAGSSPSA